MTQDLVAIIKKQTQAAMTASSVMAILQTPIKNGALLAIADALEQCSEDILAANARDRADYPNMSRAMTQRLTLSRERITHIATSIRAIAALSDPVGEIERMTKRPNGLLVGRMRIPIGVIGAIFESRPNVIAEIAGLILKSGNACVLRGGKEALETNKILARIIREAAGRAGVPVDFLQFIEIPDHEIVRVLCEDSEHIDLMISRGGTALIETVRTHAKMPVLAHNKGICHIYIEKSADHEKAIRIAVNAKVSNPSACNSAETILIDETIASVILPPLIVEFEKSGVEVRGCEKAKD